MVELAVSGSGGLYLLEVFKQKLGKGWKSDESWINASLVCEKNTD